MFKKIKQFFDNIFNSNKQILIQAPSIDENEKIVFNNDENTNSINDTLKSQVIGFDENRERLLTMQNDFRNGIINEEDLSEEDFEELSKLYEKQISEKENSINEYKNKILFIRKKLEESA